jgi:hypothetical protein
MRRVNAATQVVLDARALYARRLAEVVREHGSPPYMQQRIDPRTHDARIQRMTAEDMMRLMQTDPVAAEAAARRAAEIEARSAGRPRLPAQDIFEP